MQPSSYLPLYRKYRPQSLPALVGQGNIVQTLTNAIQMNRIAHAYLFTGPRGTGKTSSARILAKSLNCEQGPTIHPCQVCDSCLNITAGNDLDVIEFDAASNGSVEDARDLIESCQFAPMAGRFKIYIIDEIHMLSTQAFNALLKTLEEPPERVIFIFATTEAHKVLPTIVSRCQQFHFSRIATPAIHAHLISVCEQESLKIESDALLHLARKARGGLRDALSTLDQTAVLARERDTPLTLKELIEFLGEVPEEQMLHLVQAMIEEDAQAILDTLNHFDDAGIEAPQVVKPLMVSFRHLLVACAVGSAQLTPDDLDISEAVLQAVKTLAPKSNASQVSRFLQGLHELEQALRHAQDPALTLEVGLLSMTMNPVSQDVHTLNQRIEALERQIQSLSSPASRQHAPMMPPPLSPPTAPPPYMPPPLAPASITTMPPTMPAPAVVPQNMPSNVASSDVSALHQRICASIQSGAAKALFLQHVQIIKQDAPKLVLYCRSKALLKTIQTPEKLGHYRKAVTQVLGFEPILTFETNVPEAVLSPPPAPTPLLEETPEAPAIMPMPDSPPPLTPTPVPVISHVANETNTPNVLESMPSLEFDAVSPAHNNADAPPPLWEDEDTAAKPNNAPPTSMSPPLAVPQSTRGGVDLKASSSITVQGSHGDLDESKGFVATLLQATDINDLPLEEENTETSPRLDEIEEDAVL
jgi:DNA polymerase-3 subunit gamma/tau